MAAKCLTLEDELISFRCDLDLSRPYNESIFHFAKNRRIEHYGPITEQTAAVLRQENEL